MSYFTSTPWFLTISTAWFRTTSTAWSRATSTVCPIHYHCLIQNCLIRSRCPYFPFCLCPSLSSSLSSSRCLCPVREIWQRVWELLHFKQFGSESPSKRIKTKRSELKVTWSKPPCWGLQCSMTTHHPNLPTFASAPMHTFLGRPPLSSSILIFSICISMRLCSSSMRWISSFIFSCSSNVCPQARMSQVYAEGQSSYLCPENSSQQCTVRWALDSSMSMMFFIHLAMCCG